MIILNRQAWAYYNDFEPSAVSWLRELIKRGLIADGEVDGRSILDVTAADLTDFRQCHFFAGIGGWSYALRLAGWRDDWPVWTGSPPCQPFSAAGRQKGQDDERHLAPHFAQLVADGRPPILFGEQVASAAVFGKPASKAKRSVTGKPDWAWIDDLSGRLEAAHYAVGASDLPAESVGAPHIRQRTFFGAVRLEHPHGCGARTDTRSDREIGCEAIGDVWAEDGAALSLRAGATGGLEYASNTGSQRGLRGGSDQEREGFDGYLGRDGAVSGLDNALFAGTGWDNGTIPRTEGEETWRRGSTGAPSGVCRLADRGWPRQIDDPWRDADWLHCRDAKWRPVEPSTFPLAHGLPARVGRLRGYGNAIVPQAAAHFIQTFVESLRDFAEPEQPVGADHPVGDFEDLLG